MPKAAIDLIYLFAFSFLAAPLSAAQSRTATTPQIIIVRNVVSYAPSALVISLLAIIGPAIAAGIREKFAMLKFTGKLAGPYCLLMNADVIVGLPP